MIGPNLATMLAFVFTDAPIAAGALQSLLKSGVEDTFNAVTIDGDTSTSDTLLAFATGTAAANGAPRIGRASDPRLTAFTKALRTVLADLAEPVAQPLKLVLVAPRGVDAQMVQHRRRQVGRQTRPVDVTVLQHQRTSASV